MESIDHGNAGNFGIAALDPVDTLEDLLLLLARTMSERQLQMRCQIPSAWLGHS